MLVRNNEANVKTFGNPLKGGFTLLPGNNEINKELFTKWLGMSKGLKHWTKAKIVEAVEVRVEAKGQPTVVKNVSQKEVPDLKADEAIAIVEDTFDKGLLCRWLEDDGRVTVIRAIERQIEILDREVKGDEDSD